MKQIFTLFFAILPFSGAFAGSHNTNTQKVDPWYTEGNYSPTTRIAITITNPLKVERKDCPVTIENHELPFSNFGSRELAVVDPALPPGPEPTREEKLQFGGHLLLGEKNGVSLLYQMDDLDRDGIWDELFFMTDLKPLETKTIYLYLGYNNRGMYPHATFAAIGDYGRHSVPMWESELLTWKLWYPTDIDIQVKRHRMLNGYYSLVNNLSGYNFSYDKGMDIMTVGNTFGAGGIGLFEFPQLDSISRPRFSPYTYSGPLENTRYVNEVVASGPIRSIVRVKTLNWRTGQGEYELEQYYTAYKNKYYSTCKVVYTKWHPQDGRADFGAGIRKIMFETEKYTSGGTVISIAKDMPVIDPNPLSLERLRSTLDYAATALIVKDKYKPEYKYISAFEGNHALRMPLTKDLTFEYLITAGWNDAPDYRTIPEFKKYIKELAVDYNSPPTVSNFKLEKKAEGYKPIEYWAPPREQN